MKTKFKLLLATTAFCFGSVQMSQGQGPNTGSGNNPSGEQTVAEAKAAAISAAVVAFESGDEAATKDAIAKALLAYPEMTGDLTTALLDAKGGTAYNTFTKQVFGAVGSNTPSKHRSAMIRAFGDADNPNYDPRSRGNLMLLRYIAIESPFTGIAGQELGTTVTGSSVSEPDPVS